MNTSNEGAKWQKCFFFVRGGGCVGGKKEETAFISERLRCTQIQLRTRNKTKTKSKDQRLKPPRSEAKSYTYFFLWSDSGLPSSHFPRNSINQDRQTKDTLIKISISLYHHQSNHYPCSPYKFIDSLHPPPAPSITMYHFFAAKPNTKPTGNEGKKRKMDNFFPNTLKKKKKFFFFAFH